jgi:hypothetical protein
VAKTHSLTYIVHLSDQTLVTTLAARYPQGVVRAPYNPVGPGGMAVEAANLLIAAGVSVTSPLPLLEVGAAFHTNALTSPYFDASNAFPRDVATFTKSSGWWIFGSSTTFHWVAYFSYSPLAGAQPPVDQSGGTGTPDIPDTIEQALIPQRSYFDGIELPSLTEGNATGGLPYHTPAGAVLFEGTGFAMRQTGTTTNSRSYAPVNLTKVWSRFRLKVRRFGTGQSGVYRLETQSTSSAGLRVYLTATGQFALFTADASTETLVTVAGQVALNERVRIDAFAYCGPNAGGTVPEMELYFCVNGELLFHTTLLPGGLVANAKFASIFVGHVPSTASLAEIDFDDWRDAALPQDKDFRTAAYDNAHTYSAGDLVLWASPNTMPVTKNDIFRTQWHKPVLGFEIFKSVAGGLGVAPRTGIQMNAGWTRLVDSADFLLGSRLVLARPQSVVSMTNWAPAHVGMLALPQINDDTTVNGVSSTTALSEIQLKTNALTRIGGIPGCQGWAGFLVAVRSLRGTTSGQLGYKIGAAARVMTVITEAGAIGPNRVLYTPSTLTAPEALADLEVHYQKGNDVTTGRVTLLCAVVEALGLFAPEDRAKAWTADDADTVNHGSWGVDADLDVPVQPLGLHNAPFYDTPWQRAALPPIGPVMIVGGTYVGNGVGQDLAFKVPPALLWIRPTTLTNPGSKWWPSIAQMGGTYRNQRSLGYVTIPTVFKDDTFVPASADADQQMRFLVRLAGADAGVNQNAITYQYIAFCDPAARFCLSGAVSHVNDASRVPVTDALERSGFTPEFGLFHRGQAGTSSTDDLWAKGTGHTTDLASNLPSTAAAAAAITYGAGQLTFNTGFLQSISSSDFYSFVLFRREDGNADPNAPKLMAMGDYLGDGSASRSVSTGRITGLRPIFLLVVPQNASAAVMRDPSHTGTTSQNISGTSNASTGITGGAVDGFSVGSTLNANGVTYSWFMLLGGATACNNGFGCNGEYTPVTTDTPVDPTFPAAPDPDDPFPPTEPTPTPEPTPDTGPEPDLATACVAYTQKIVNQALSEVGVTRQITDLVAENSQEAATSRLHIKDDIDEVLRRFAWPFAKRYATLVVVAGTTTTPVNPDWQYSYRAPADMVEARRITSQVGTKRQYDPNPIAFERGQDATGELIYTDAEAVQSGVPVVLEYTARVTCPASQGDALFREAVKWKHAASLAPGLSKDAQKAQYCEAKFRDVLETARVRWGNEQQSQKPDNGDPDWIRGR